MMRSSPERARSLIVLVDETLLTIGGATRLDYNTLESLLEDVVTLWREKLRVTIVVTGEASIGRIRCGSLTAVPRERRNDVWGAVGRTSLEAWISSRLAESGLRTGALHLTRSSFASRRTYTAVRDCLRGLESNGAMPIVWNNDWMGKRSTPHNADQLMALVAGQAGAEMAVIGLAEPVLLRKGGESWAPGRISLRDLEEGIEGDIRVVSPSQQRMESVIAAGRLLGAMGTPLMIVGLKGASTLKKALRGEIERLILEGDEAPSGKAGVRRWLSAGAIPQGVIVVSPYAATQLSDDLDRASLLAAGVVETVGEYRENDVVAIEDESRNLLGYGVTKFGSREVAELRGQRNVIIVHADQFYGVGLRELVEDGEELVEDKPVERT